MSAAEGNYRSVWANMMRTEFTQAYVVADQLRTRYVQAGSPDAPPVIMLHGTGGHWETFCFNIPVLAERFRCTAVDMLGCGFTDKPDKPYEIADYVSHINAFMDRLKIRKASFIGVSLGSWVAARLAVDYPQRVDKLILASPAGLSTKLPGSNEVRDARQNSAADPSWDNIRRILRHLVFEDRSVMDDIIAVRQQVYSGPNMTALMPRMLTLMQPEFRAKSVIPAEQWKTIQAPVLVVKAVDSVDSSSNNADTAMSLLPRAKLLEMPRTAHWPHFEDPERFNTEAMAFLSQLNALE